MSLPRIALDLDGVVYKWSETVRYLVQTHHGIELGESTHWDYVKDNVPPEVWRWVWTDGVRLGMFRYGHLYRGTVEGVHALAELGAVEVVTHRPEAAVHDTLRFLSYVELPLSGVHVLTNQEPKSSVGCDIYVDDGPHVVEEVLAAGRRAVIVNRPWNTSLLQAGNGSASFAAALDGRLLRAHTWNPSDERLSIPEAVEELLK